VNTRGSLTVVTAVPACVLARVFWPAVACARRVPVSQAVEALFDEFDSDRSGVIDLPELLNFVAYDKPELCVPRPPLPLHAPALPHAQGRGNCA
jgi:hypothetical protein